MGKKLDDLLIALRLRCFMYEECPQHLADELVEKFASMADPVFPVNGNESVNRVQLRARRDWLTNFLYFLIIKSYDMIQELNNEQ